MRNNEQGRSMIEMLGVLAIVGVLSVGGIAGYSKAMGKFKTNKLIDQINMIATNVRTLYASQPNYHGLTETLAKQVNLIPAEMYTSVDDGNITNAFGGPVHLTPSAANSDEGENAEKAYILSVSGVPSTACVSIVTTDWGSDSDAGLVGMMAAVGEDDTAVVSELDAFTLDQQEAGDGDGEDDAADIHTPGNNIPYNIVATNTACGVNTMTAIGWKFM